MKNGKQTAYDGVRQSVALTSWRRGIGLLLVLAATVASAQNEQPNAVKFKTLANFDSTNGDPQAALVQGRDGKLYGTTIVSGPNNGTVFSVTPAGALTVLHQFSGPDGGDPLTPVIEAPDGSFYGLTQQGGSPGADCPNLFGCGIFFKITSTGTFSVLYNFCSQPNCSDGDQPLGLALGSDGNLYGTTATGGTITACLNGCGTAFKVTLKGVLTTLYSFCVQPNCTDGAAPYSLALGRDGSLYGATNGGGSYGYGTIFKMSRQGSLTTLHSFDNTDGAYPSPGSPLIQAADGDLYGTAPLGGATGNGTVYKITTGGAFTLLHSFCTHPGCPDGSFPYGPLVQATDGIFYGSTNAGQINCGTIYKIDSAGALKTLYQFTCTSDGGYPAGGLIQDTNGALYGTTSFGGANNNGGTVFSLSVGLGPFVETSPTSGKVGATIQILGTNLSGATSASFNGAMAAFSVISKTLITATVPAGATTGFVTVTGPNGTLKSNVKFQVR